MSTNDQPPSFVPAGTSPASGTGNPTPQSSSGQVEEEEALESAIHKPKVFHSAADFSHLDEDMRALSNKALSEGTWESIGLNPELVTAAKNNPRWRGTDGSLSRPTVVQLSTVPLALAGHHVVGQALGGSGKTGAFVLSALSAIDPSVKAPQVIILAMNRLLCRQIAHTEAFALVDEYISAKGLQPRSISMTLATSDSGFARDNRKKKFTDQIIVGTPQWISEVFFHKMSKTDMSNLKMIVVDEADTMISTTTTSNNLPSFLRTYVRYMSDPRDRSAQVKLPQILLYSASFEWDEVTLKSFRDIFRLEPGWTLNNRLRNPNDRRLAMVLVKPRDLTHLDVPHFLWKIDSKTVNRYIDEDMKMEDIPFTPSALIRDLAAKLQVQMSNQRLSEDKKMFEVKLHYLALLVSMVSMHTVVFVSSNQEVWDAKDRLESLVEDLTGDVITLCSRGKGGERLRNIEVQLTDARTKLASSGKRAIIIATPIAERGIDFETLAMVVNMNVPFQYPDRNKPDYTSFQHRFGRLGRVSQSSLGRAAVIHFVSSNQEHRRLENICNYFSIQSDPNKDTSEDFPVKLLSLPPSPYNAALSIIERARKDKTKASQAFIDPHAFAAAAPAPVAQASAPVAQAPAPATQAPATQAPATQAPATQASAPQSGQTPQGGQVGPVGHPAQHHYYPPGYHDPYAHIPPGHPPHPAGPGGPEHPGQSHEGPGGPGGPGGPFPPYGYPPVPGYPPYHYQPPPYGYPPMPYQPGPPGQHGAPPSHGEHGGEMRHPQHFHGHHPHGHPGFAAGAPGQHHPGQGQPPHPQGPKQ